MASLKPEKPAGAQSTGPAKKENTKAPASKSGTKKTEVKPREPKKKVNTK